MSWRNLPSLNALRAFSALAEAGSYSRAGGMLNVTHAAVMQQVKSLEEYLGVRLATRAGRGIALTDEGQALARELEAGFRRIQHGVSTLAEKEQTRPVQVTMSPVFAVMWLMPRLADFQVNHPDITLLLNPSGNVLELTPGGVDVAIRYGRNMDAAGDVDILIYLDLVVVGTPELVGTVNVSGPADLRHLPWLQELGTREVPDWFVRHGVQLDRPLMISHMPGNLIMDAVKRGDGITYTTRQWVEDEIRAGDLVELTSDKDVGYFSFTRFRQRSVRR